MSRVHDIDRRTTLALALAVPVAVVLGSLARIDAMDHFVASETYEDVYYVPPAEWLPVFALGWDSAAADLLWARALVYFGEEMGHRGGMRHVYEYADAMIALDPDFREAYAWAGLAGLYRPEEVSADDARQAVEYLRRGHERFPDDDELVWQLGAALAFELPSFLASPDERAEARAQGADYLAEAARRGVGPPWLALSSAAILSRVGRAEAAADHLEEMYAMTEDEAVREQIASAIGELRSGAYAEALVEVDREEEARRARDLPYLSRDLYFLVGPRPVVPWREAYRDGFAADAIAAERGALGDLGAAP